MIWKLTPTNRSDVRWYWYSCEPVIVRAGSEEQARGQAVRGILAYVLSLQRYEDVATRRSPWGDAAVTACEDITAQDHGYPLDGPAEVLAYGDEGL